MNDVEFIITLTIDHELIPTQSDDGVGGERVVIVTYLREFISQ